MDKYITILKLCKQARDKGFSVRVTNDGERTEFCHQSVEDYKVLINITTYTDDGLDTIINYLEGMVQ